LTTGRGPSSPEAAASATAGGVAVRNGGVSGGGYAAVIVCERAAIRTAAWR
jgi:hypothetical protein